MMLPGRGGGFHPRCPAPVLPATAKASPIAEAAPVASAGILALPGLEAVLAVHGTIAAGLEWHGGLLSASGAYYRRTPRLTALVSPARLFLFLGLTTLFAALRRRISAFIEERLIFGGKRERSPAIAAHEFLIPSHVSSFRSCFKYV